MEPDVEQVSRPQIQFCPDLRKTASGKDGIQLKFKCYCSFVSYVFSLLFLNDSLQRKRRPLPGAHPKMPWGRPLW